jgi:hypothetical protein
MLQTSVLVGSTGADQGELMNAVKWAALISLRVGASNKHARGLSWHDSLEMTSPSLERHEGCVGAALICCHDPVDFISTIKKAP